MHEHCGFTDVSAPSSSSSRLVQRFGAFLRRHWPNVRWRGESRYVSKAAVFVQRKFLRRR